MTLMYIYQLLNISISKSRMNSFTSTKYARYRGFVGSENDISFVTQSIG